MAGPRQVAGSRPFRCTFCQKAFAKSSHRRQHVILQHENAGQYECQYCNKTFPSRTNWENHTRTHTGERPFRCESCPSAFNTKFHLDRHHLDMHSEKNIQCAICHKLFGRIYAAYRHQDCHREKTFRCERCPERFSSRDRLRSHHMRHHVEKKHQCDICGERFVWPCLLRQHLRKHPSERFECRLCKSSFQLEQTLKRHQERLHDDDASATGRPSDRSRYKARLSRDKDEEYVRPNDSDRLASAVYNLRARGKTPNYQDDYDETSESDETSEPDESQESDDESNESDEATRDGDVLEEEQNDNQKKKFKCPVCSKRFGTTACVQRHLYSHSRERVECKLCKRWFKHEYGLQRHQASHHPVLATEREAPEPRWLARGNDQEENRMEIVQLNSSNVLMAIDTLLLPGAQFEEFEEFEEVGALYDRRDETSNTMNDQDNTESKERNEGKLSRIFACYDSDDELSDSNEETRCDDVFEKAKQNDPAEEDDGDSVTPPETSGPRDDDQSEEVVQPEGNGVSVAITYARGQTPNYRVNLEDMVESDEEPNRRTENNRNAIPLIELSSVEDDEL